MSTQAILEQVQEITKTVKAQDERLSAIEKSAKEAREGFLGGAPHARRGEDPLSSRGFSYLKLFGFMDRKVEAQDAKVEIDVHNKLQKLYVDRLGFNKGVANSVVAPFATEHLAQFAQADQDVVSEITTTVKAGVRGYDPREVAYWRARGAGLDHRKAMSWTDATLGESLVAPPVQGELIELLRTNEIFLKAGARSIPMSPSGRAVYPAQKGAGTAYWVGQSDTVTDSQPATGDVILTAKKLGMIVKIPNELFRYASVSVEMFVRQDVAEVMGRRLDKSLLEAVGSAYEPKGLLSYSQVAAHTAFKAAADANSGYIFQPEDVAFMVADVEEQNASGPFSFVMRPRLWSAIVNRRANVYNGSGTESTGPFVFNTFRTLGDGMALGREDVGNLEGYPVYKSTQLSANRTRGTGSTQNSYVLGGNFGDFIVALSGVIEFVISTTGDTPLQNDQTWVRGIQHCDGAPRHEASFVVFDQVQSA